MKKCAIATALSASLLVAGCSGGGPTPDQQRIAQLEQEKAQLQEDLKQAKDNVTKLQAAIGRSQATGDEGEAAPSGPVAPAPVNPQPDNNVGGEGGGP